MVIKNKDNDKESLINRNRLLELENANLKNQIISLSNALKKSYNSENIDQNKDNNDYKEKFEALLQHFKDQVEIIDGKVVDHLVELDLLKFLKYNITLNY